MPIYDHDGTFDSWDGELLMGSNKFTNKTGGYSTSGWTENTYMISAQNTTQGIAIHSGTGTWHRTGTQNKIDVSKYTTITITCSIPKGCYTLNVYFGLYPNKTSVYNQNAAAYATESNYTNLYTYERTYTINVSNLSSSYYLGLYCYSGEGYPVTITSIDMTPKTGGTGGLVKYKISKICDADANNTKYPIGKVYDYDGTTKRLVYSSTMVILDGSTNTAGTPAFHKTDSGDGNHRTWVDSGGWRVQGNGRVSAALNNKVTISGYSYLCFEITANNVFTGNGYAAFGYRTDTKGWINAAGVTVDTRVVWTTYGQTGTAKVQIRSGDSSAYIIVEEMSQGVGISSDCGVTIKKIWLE